VPRFLKWAKWILFALLAATSVGLVLLVCSIYQVTPPKEPSDQEVAAVVARFAASRPVLERIVALEHERDSLTSDLPDSIAGPTHRRFERLQDSLAATIRSPESPRETWVWHIEGDTYVITWARRGQGPSAGWWVVGFVHAWTPPSRARDRGFYGWDSGRHLDGAWYWFKMHQEM
jgi:hypothetical protein